MNKNNPALTNPPDYLDVGPNKTDVTADNKAPWTGYLDGYKAGLDIVRHLHHNPDEIGSNVIAHRLTGHNLDAPFASGVLAFLERLLPTADLSQAEALMQRLNAQHSAIFD